MHATARTLNVDQISAPGPLTLESAKAYVRDYYRHAEPASVVDVIGCGFTSADVVRLNVAIGSDLYVWDVWIEDGFHYGEF